MSDRQITDFGREKFKEIGTLSAIFPAYVRHCCRALYDGTDIEVLNAYREIGYKVLVNYRDKYDFARKHCELLQAYDPAMVQEVIQCNPSESKSVAFQCFAISSSVGLPKRACLHCPKVGAWIKIMNRAGTTNHETGERYDYK